MDELHEETRRFQKGDRVIVVRDGGDVSARVSVGAIGTIADYGYSEGSYFVYFDGRGDSWYLRNHHLELYETELLSIDESDLLEVIFYEQ